ncbi:MAG: dihydropteroate synthase [Proteobacteria bacterium]|nr:dihydropteroate synthase [Pseudomonadota bacterium]
MMLVADNMQVINATVSKAMEDMNSGPIRALAAKCSARGAHAIDVNSGPLGKGAKQKMAFLIESVQEVTALPILIDTANPVAMEAGLAVSRNPVIINGFSLEPVKMAGILPLAKKYNADIIGYLLNSDSSVPLDSGERLTIASQLLAAIEEEGISPERLIIDPVIVPLSWEQGTFQAMEVLSTLKLLPEVLGYPVRTIAGLSNLTSGSKCYKKSIWMENIYLPMLATANLSMVLLNIFHDETVAVAKTCRILEEGKIFSWESI